MTMNRKLEGKVALVTGSGRGIGRAIALKLASEGAQVVVNDLDEAPALETVQAITAAGGTVSVWEPPRRFQTRLDQPDDGDRAHPGAVGPPTASTSTTPSRTPSARRTPQT